MYHEPEAQLRPGWESPADCCQGGTPLQAHKPGQEVTPFPAPGTAQQLRTVWQHRNERQNNPQGVGRTPNAVATVRFSRKPAKAGEALPGEGRSGTDHSPRRASALFSFLAPVHCFPPPSPVLNEREGNSRKAHSEESHVPIHCSQNSKLLIQWLQGPENLSWLKQSLICAIKLPAGKSVHPSDTV